MKDVEAVAERIKKLEIQGATSVALSALEAVKGFAERNPEKSVEEAVNKLLETRPTEPLMINTLNYLKYLDRGRVSHQTGEFVKYIQDGMKRVVKIGANLIQDGMVVQTICHSQTVVDVLLKARNDGKRVRAVNTETRPRYQGRKTAEELYKGGVPVEHYVDSAMMKAMKDNQIDLCLIGLDAIFMDGSIMNKIGSGLLAIAAESMSIPLYACGLSLKFDKDSLFAKNVEIEERDPREVWDYPVQTHNPAFELVPAKRLTGIVTEAGVFPPAVAGYEIMQKHPHLFKT